MSRARAIAFRAVVNTGATAFVAAGWETVYSRGHFESYDVLMILASVGLAMAWLGVVPPDTPEGPR